MHRFFEGIIGPLLAIYRPKVIVEIGVDEGKHTRKLLAYCAQYNTTLHAIDPSPNLDVALLEKEWPDALVFHQEQSLTALPNIPSYDAVLIDGDHNWYTVLHELQLIERHAQERGSFPLVFLHDIDWPYGRRDLYYAPENIPPEHRHAYSKSGMAPGTPKLVEHGGLNMDKCNAIAEGGPRNGVRTAIEDFLQQTKLQLERADVPGLHGLCILASKELLERNLPFASLFTQWQILPGPARAHCQLLEQERIKAHVQQYSTERSMEQGYLCKDRDFHALHNAYCKKDFELRAVQRVYHSRSWRWTAWIRKLEKTIRKT